jgi:hypothetical protein
VCGARTKEDGRLIVKSDKDRKRKVQEAGKYFGRKKQTVEKKYFMGKRL